MKPVLKSILTIILLTFTIGCEKVFDELSVNPNQLSVTGYYTSPEAINSGIIGTYGYISTPRNLGASGTGTMFNRGDETSSDADYCVAGQYNAQLSPSYYTIVQPFALMYTVASQASQMIETTPDVAFDDEELKNAYMGEAYCLRAFAHFFLLIHYRNIPVVRNMPKDASDYVRPQEDPIDVWNFIIEDLKMAKQLLPGKDYWDVKNKGRVTKASAAGLLGRVYLYMTGIENNYGAGGLNYYSEAAKEFGEIINGDFGNYSLEPTYSDNFSVINENNNESLLEFQFLGDVENTGFNPGFVSSGLFNDYRGFSPPYGYSGREVVVHDWLYDAFVASQDVNGNTDLRMFGTLVFDESDPNIKTPPGYGITLLDGKTWTETYGAAGFGAARSNAAPYKASNRKWLDWTLPGQDPGNGMYFLNARAHGSNWRFIRYADVLLMYAESVLMGGSQTSVAPVDAVNIVRQRANVPLLSNVSMDEIRAERVLELSLEGHRFFDLLRWGTVADRFADLESTDPNFKQFNSSPYLGFTPNKHEWLPIPIDEIESNPNINQNNQGW